MCVDLRRGQTLMPKQLLNSTKVGSIVEQMSCEGVAQGMRVHVRSPLGIDVTVEQTTNAPRPQSCAARVEEDRMAIGPVRIPLE